MLVYSREMEKTMTKAKGFLWAVFGLALCMFPLNCTGDGFTRLRDVPRTNYPGDNFHSNDLLAFTSNYEFTAAIKEDGTLWTWGYGGDGALGHGTTDDKLLPTQVGTDNDWVGSSLSSVVP